MDDRTPPHNLGAERTVLGAILIEGGAYKKAKAIVNPVDFRHEAHRLIFSAMGQLHDGGGVIDLTTLQDQLEKNGDLDIAGGVSYLSELMSVTPTAGHVRHHARIVKQKATQRKLLEVAYRIQDEIYEEGKPADEVGHGAIAAISQVIQGGNTTRFADMAEVAVSTVKGLEEYAGTDRTTLGVPTGLTEYDQMVGGFCSGDLVVIAARPAVGKTSLMCSMAEYQARALGTGVAIFSLEQAGEELGRKLFALLERTIDLKQFRTGPISDAFWEKVTGAAKSLSGLPIYIEDSPRQTVYQIADRARVLAAEKQVDVVYIDYLQLIHPHRQEPPYIITGEQTKELKALAHELKVPVVVMSQVSREVERRKDRRPQLSELRWSGDIEQDADLVTFIHREDLYSQDGAGRSAVEAELIVKKNRHGPTGTVIVQFVKKTAHFVQHYSLGDYEAGLLDPEDLQESHE